MCQVTLAHNQPSKILAENTIYQRINKQINICVVKRFIITLQK